MVDVRVVMKNYTVTRFDDFGRTSRGELGQINQPIDYREEFT